MIAMETRAITPSWPILFKIVAKFWYTDLINADSGPNKTPKSKDTETTKRRISVDFSRNSFSLEKLKLKVGDEEMS